MRINSQELEIPLTYTDKTHSIDAYGYQCSSGVITVFQKGPVGQKRFYVKENNANTENEKGYYCDDQSQTSKKLYANKLLLKKRSVIESVNEILKSSYQIEHSRHRRSVNFFVNLIAVLLLILFVTKNHRSNVVCDQIILLLVFDNSELTL